MRGYDVIYDTYATQESIESTVLRFSSADGAQRLAKIGLESNNDTEPASPSSVPGIPGSLVTVSKTADKDGYYYVDAVVAKGSLLMVVEYSNNGKPDGAPTVLVASALIRHDGSVWRLYLARAGIEWSMQFCADPAKVELLRQDAVALLAAFPATRQALTDLGYHELSRLDTPVTTADDVAWYTDSIFNACVPLDRLKHQGVLPSGAGKHHYPEPIVAAENFKVDSFVLFVDLPGGGHVAVSPVSPPGSGDGRARVLEATDGTQAKAAVLQAEASGQAVIVGPDHPIAKAAFANQ